MKARPIRFGSSRKIRFTVLLLAAMSLSVLSGCRNPFNRSGNETGTGTGTFLLNLGGVSRTISPQWPDREDLRIGLLFTSPDHADLNVSAWTRDTPVSLPSGTWALTVTVFTVAGNYPIATGTLSPITVNPGASVGGTVTLNPILDPYAPPGTFAWDIAVPPGIEVTGTHLLVTPAGGGGAVHDAFVDVSGSYRPPPGIYNVIFTLTVADREDAVIREVLHVYSNMTSRFVETLGSLHFPETLLGIILEAWDRYDKLNSQGEIPGSVRAYLEYRGLRAGHFGLLNISGLDLVYGFGDDDFPALLNWFATLPGTIPYDLPSLARLVDAALVGVGMLGEPDSPVFPPPPGNRLAAQDLIRALVVNNWDDPDFVGFDWAGVYEPVLVNVGGYSLRIPFAGAVYDYRLSFDSNGGDGWQPDIRAYSGQTATLPDAPGIRPDRLFTGWNTQANGGGRQHLGGSPFAVVGDLTLYAAWVITDGKPVTVTLDSGEGSGGRLPLTSVPAGTQIILPPLPGSFANPGSHFTGWSLDGESLLPVGSPFAVAGPSLVFVAQWKATVDGPLRTVTINPNARDAGDPIVMSVPQGTTLTLPGGGFVREWHDLLPRWYIRAESVVTDDDYAGDGPGHDFYERIPVHEDGTLYARWHRPAFTVSFDVAGGSVVSGYEGDGIATRSEPRGTVINLPVLERPGHTFEGWSTEIDGERRHLGLAPFLVVRQTRLTAEWIVGEAPSFAVTFLPNGGRESPIVTGAPAGTVMPLPPGSFTRPGHAFLGWHYGSPDGPLYLGGTPFAVMRELRFYAAWVSAPEGGAPPHTFTVALKPNGGQGDPFSLTPAPMGTVVSLPGTGFDKYQHFLYGWSAIPVDPGGPRDHATNALFTVSGNLDLFAVWRFATVERVVVSPETATLTRGETMSFTVSVTGQGIPPQNVNWSLSGAVSPGTNIDPSSGLLTIGQGQTPGGEVITVHAESPLNPNADATTASVSVLPPTASTVTVGGPAQTAVRGTVTGGFTAEVSGVGFPSNSVAWSVLAGDGVSLHPGTAMLGATLSVSPDQQPGILRVLATSVYAATPGHSRVGEIAIEVPQPVVTGIVINPENPSLERGSSLPLVAEVVGIGNPPQDVSWTMLTTGFTQATGINAAGLLTVPGNEAMAAALPFFDVTVRVRSDFDDSFFKDVVVRVTGPVRVGEWRKVRVGIDHTMAITWGNRLYTWGRNQHGQLGRLDTGETTGTDPQARPRRVGTREDWLYVSGGWGHSLGLTADGRLHEWGAIRTGVGAGGGPAAGGREGDVPRYVPTEHTDWVSITSGHSSNFAIRADGSLWAWGHNPGGRLGVGDTLPKDEPARVGKPTSPGDRWHYVSAGNRHTAAVTEQGHIYVWGENGSSQLGEGAASTVPRRLEGGGDRLWRSVAAGGNWRGGTSFTVAICREGFMYFWGSNYGGFIGTNTDGTATPGNQVLPVKVNENTWASVHLNNTVHVVAIDSRGRLWTWGANTHGQIGQGLAGTGDVPNPVIQHPVPVLMEWHDGGLFPADIGWISSIGGGSFSMAVDAEGRLWGWGHNQHGMLGDGTVVNRLSPVPADSPVP